MKDFTDRVIAITGAGSGLGRALALQFARHGGRLALCDQHPDRLRETEQALARAHPGERDVLLTEVDVADRSAVFAWAQDVVDHFGAVHVLINNAGVSLTATVQDMKPEDLRWLLEVNLLGTVSGCQAFLPHLQAVAEGHIVNISSIFGIMGVPRQSAYNMSKFAVRGLSDALALELAGTTVGVMCVHPGGLRTRIVRDGRFSGANSAAVIERFESRLARNPPEYCAEQIFRGLQRGKQRLVVGADAWLLDFLVRLFPGSYHRLVSRLAAQ